MISLHPATTNFHWTDRPHNGLRRLTEDEVQQFDDQGYVLVGDAFSAAGIAALIDAWESRTTAFLHIQPNASMSVATADEITFTVHLVLRSGTARAFRPAPGAHRSVHDLIGPDARLCWDQAVYKKREPHREFPWHQDNGYAFVEPHQYLTCWVPLTDATIETGARGCRASTATPHSPIGRRPSASNAWMTRLVPLP